MANIHHLCISFLVVTSSIPVDVSAAKILGIFPHTGKSHFFVFEPLMRELAARGHDVYVLGHFPQKTPVPNYTDISLQGTQLQFDPTDGVSFELADKSSPWADFVGLAEWGSLTCEVVYSLPPVKKLLRSNDTFDLVISELFNTNCFLGFVHKFQASHIALSSCTIMPWANDRFGNPDHPAYIPFNLLRDLNLKFFHNRLISALKYIVIKALTPYFYDRPAQKIAEKHFDSSLPPIDDIAMNTSLMLVNTHPSLNGPRPMVPAVVEVGGLHLKPPKSLPEELDRWLIESKHGVIYFNMGSMLRAETLPAEKRAALLQAFSELPQRVLWKWEGDSFPGKPDNVRIAKWLPQRDILNHPSVRVFMAHGGLLGIMEAVVSGVPVVATPIYGDQFINSKALEDKGAAFILHYPDISKDSVLNALRTVLEDSSYQKNAKRLAREFLDRPLSPMETAVFWTEYVIRHKGAPHLRSAAVDLSWYQYLLLDVALVLLAGAILLALIAYLVVRKIIQFYKYCVGKEAVKSKQS